MVMHVFIARIHILAASTVMLITVGCAHTGQRVTSDAVSNTESNAVPASVEVKPPPSMDTPPAELKPGPTETARAAALAHYATAIIRELAGDPGGALEEYLKSVENDPTNKDLITRLMRVLPSQPQLLPKAVPALTAATRINPESTDLWMLLGIAQRANNDFTGALDSFDRVLKMVPVNHWALRQALEICVEQNWIHKAVPIIETALTQNPGTGPFWRELAALMDDVRQRDPVKAGKYDQNLVMRTFERSLAMSPDDLETLVRMVSMYEKAGQQDKADELYNKILSAQPDDFGMHLRLAQHFAATGAGRKAVELVENTIKKFPLRHELYNYLAELYVSLEQPDKAIGTFQQSLVLNPAQVDVQLRIAMLQVDGKQFEQALKTLADARAKFPQVYQVPFYTALAHMEAKNYPQALAEFAEAEKLAVTAPDPVELDSSFYFYHGSAQERAGNIEKAAELFKRALELKPDNHAALNYLGYMWAEKGMNLDEAHKMINRAVELSPDNAAYIDSLGWVLYQKGRYEEAYPHLKRAAEMITEDAIVFDHLADVLVKLGRVKEAITYYRKALEMEPENKGIQEKLQKLAPDRR